MCLQALNSNTICPNCAQLKFTLDSTEQTPPAGDHNCGFSLRETSAHARCVGCICQGRGERSVRVPLG